MWVYICILHMLQFLFCEYLVWHYLPFLLENYVKVSPNALYKSLLWSKNKQMNLELWHQMHKTLNLDSTITFVS